MWHVNRRNLLKLVVATLVQPLSFSSNSQTIRNKNYLSYYGNGRDALKAFLTFSKNNSVECYIDIDILLNDTIEFDFDYSVVKIVFLSTTLKSDRPNLILKGLGNGSYIKDAKFSTINQPWVITRWDNDLWITKPAKVLETLTRTSSPGYYQPTVNDHDIYEFLSDEQKQQDISSGIVIKDSNNVKIDCPSGFFVLISFLNCNFCSVINPKIFSGGKGRFGTIVFNNLTSSNYGVGNKVIGGTISYGSFSAITFIRNKGYQGGVFKNVNIFRSGESGIKTYQNEIDGISARCYNLTFEDVVTKQAVYDGFDFTSDYGTEEERNKDFSLHQYPWHSLPLAHKIKNLTAINCKGTGFFIDGQFSDIYNIKASDCYKDGVYISGENNNFVNVQVTNCNLLNFASGVHQFNSPNNNSISYLEVNTSNKIKKGYAVYSPKSYINKKEGLSQLKSVMKHQN